MKKLLFFSILAVSFAGCASKKPWTKDSIVNDCLRNFNKRNETEKRFSGMQIPLLCDCMAEKLAVKYKSDEESSKDEAGVTEISRDCAEKVMKK